MAEELKGITVAFLVAPEGIEQVELTEPWRAVEEVGGTPRLVSTDSGTVQAFEHLDKADTFDVDATTDTVTPDDFDALVLPGGVANPDYLRTVESAVDFIKGFFDAGKPVAAICHAPWTLVEADVVRGRSITSWPSVKTDIANAGGNWVDQEVVVDRNGPNTLITSRKPDDLAAFNSALVVEFGRSTADA
ncbi:putative protease [Gordonia polyisoprenivorans VH2]|uniref:Putative protease n=1 Tax=Gordonia polyisoprenivorans (strain DSM 44266 / VH2) TaxID=1112204 RepID=H6N135_GORPV|nr:type 1 glutamine amidotransferase domain-containing protein [Gordonia polyisoprenivorans]AFA75800.1 putative protease [Gordonia polyisoprenivorans VH2]HCS57400.1 type 1 glutamine amidotransferase [Gordonia polyisoprenivorans]